jgi:hypothetical protein
MTGRYVGDMCTTYREIATVTYMSLWYLPGLRRLRHVLLQTRRDRGTGQR